VADATGFNASLRNKLGTIFNFETQIEPFDIVLTFRKYIKRPKNYVGSEFKVFFGKYHGISWINSELPDLIDLFAGIPKLSAHKNPKEIVRELESMILKNTDGPVDFTPIRANYGGIIPTRRCLDSFCGNGFLLMGDSACQVEPLNGSGIASGMLAGYLAAKTVNSIFEAGKEFTINNLWSYNYEWITNIGAQYASLDILRLFLLSITENDVSFLIKHKIITESELRKSMIGETIRVSLLELIRKLFYGFSRMGLLLELNYAIRDADKIKKIYLN